MTSEKKKSSTRNLPVFRLSVADRRELAEKYLCPDDADEWREELAEVQRVEREEYVVAGISRSAGDAVEVRPLDEVLHLKDVRPLRADALAIRRIEIAVNWYLGEFQCAEPCPLRSGKRGRPLDDARRRLYQDLRTLLWLFNPLKPREYWEAEDALRNVGFIRLLPTRERRLRRFVGIILRAMEWHAVEVMHLTNFKAPKETKRRRYDLRDWMPRPRVRPKDMESHAVDVWVHPDRDRIYGCADKLRNANSRPAPDDAMDNPNVPAFALPQRLMMGLTEGEVAGILADIARRYGLKPPSDDRNSY
jgi:hypothetical protein